MTTPAFAFRRGSRLAGLAAVLVALSLVLTSCYGTTERDTVRNVMNRDRNAYGLRSLPAHEMLNFKAQVWADHLARVGGLSHSRLADGISGCWRRIGENVGYGGSIDSVQRAYMNSPGHRANILNGVWTHVGTGVAHRGNLVFTVQVFLQAC